MGMYTEFHFNSILKPSTPPVVINILEYMLGILEEEPEKPNHPIFTNTTRWRLMLRCDSYYFAAQTVSTLNFDSVLNSYVLCIRCNLKNYSNEIQEFINWISPYLNTCGKEFLGFYRYEEDEEPILIYS